MTFVKYALYIFGPLELISMYIVYLLTGKYHLIWKWVKSLIWRTKNQSQICHQVMNYNSFTCLMDFHFICCAQWYCILVFMSKLELKKEVLLWKASILENYNYYKTTHTPIFNRFISSDLHSMLIFQVHVIILLITRHH